MSQPHSPFCECLYWLFCQDFSRLTISYADIANSPDGKSILPVFGNLFTNEPVPHGGSLDVSDQPGFGLTLNPQLTLHPAESFLAPSPEKGLGKPDENVVV
jgi:L-rhamnonate dehydratase